jgi:hypothetical protein
MNAVFSRKSWLMSALAIGCGLLLLRHPLELALVPHRRCLLPDVSADPLQTDARAEPFILRAGGARYRITPRFGWDESARVVGVETYRFDRAARLIPVDYALAWGPVLAPPYAGKVSYSQFARFYFWHYSDPALDRETVLAHSANTHIIPADSHLRTVALCVARGDLVRLEGWLVDIDGVDDPSFHWATSRTRTDEGPGSCETVYVTRLTLNHRVYEAAAIAKDTDAGQNLPQ